MQAFFCPKNAFYLGGISHVKTGSFRSNIMHYSNYTQNTQYSIHDLVQKIDMKYCAISAYLAFYKVQFSKDRSYINY